ncbi:MAG TPA: cytochrome b/b6 domain-containing protein [Gammaproteobacteria bacterium]|nr:cytochrome b/b6 domain-containing protein [Gammaproteobacteria bacterium]
MARMASRHSATVRITHWLIAASALGLFVSGGAILVAHPRLYWGETGTLGVPALLDLPIPFVYGHSGWGRHLHFLCAWVLVTTGAVYFAAGVASRHFVDDLLPAKAAGARPPLERYNAAQRIAYLGVIFVLLPLMAATGLAMSPAIGSAWPALVETLGGHQSARTIHFAGASLLFFFLAGHVGMLVASGFGPRMRAMVIGRHERQAR